MTLETDIITAIDSLLGGRVYADEYPQMGEAPDFGSPYCTFQQIGGTPSNTFCGNTDKQNAVIQFNIWAPDADQSRALIRALEKIVTSPPLRAVSQGSAITRSGPVARTFGAQQDFSFWHTP